MVDPNVLLECFSATLQSNQSIIQQAELKLKELSVIPGFLGACLDIISLPDLKIDHAHAIKKAIAVYFKNKIVKHWTSDKIDNDEKPIIKQRILSVVISSDYDIKQQLIPVLRIMIAKDYESWDGLLQETGNLLQQHLPSDSSEFMNDDNLSHLYTGLLCFSEIARKYRWMDNKDRSNALYPIIETAFPHLLNIGNLILQNSDRLTEFSAEILKLILKIYKFVTYFDLPAPLQQKDAAIAWGNLHLGIINLQTPAYLLQSTISEQEKCFFQISKCYKWSIANLYRIFTRYSSTTLSKKFKYDEFHKMFLTEFIPPLINNFLALIEQWCGNVRWLSLTSLYYLLEFLSHCITQKSTWSLIKPYYMNIVSHLVYPLLCLSDYNLEMFDEDPIEYIHLMFDVHDGSDSPDVAALGLLVTLVFKKPNTTMEHILTFVSKELIELQLAPETLELAKKKEGILRMLGAVSGSIKEPYLSKMETFLTTMVFPSLTSEFDFLKARTLDVVASFAEIEYSSHDLSKLFHGILVNFDESSSQSTPSLPVHFQTALAIQAYLSHPEFKQILSNIILPTMSKLLELSNEIDNDAIPVVMQECVENFSQQLQPFGIDLMTKLVEQFLKLAHEIHEASNVDIDDFDGNYDVQGDKVMAAIGLVNTMITVLLSFENSKEICIKLEEVFSPAIEFVFVNRIEDFIAEIGELIENSTFLLRSISPIMWKNFDFLFESFNDGTALMYVEELIQCLQNYLNYGQQDLISNPQLANKFFQIFKLISDSDDDQIGYNDIIYSCELAQTFVLTLQNHSVNYIPEFIKSVLEVLANNSGEHHIKNNAFDVNINNTIISSLIYDSNTTLSILQTANQLLPFFERWFKLIPQLKRVYDLKLSILSLMAILNNDQILATLDPLIVQQVSKSLPLLLKELPQSMESLEKKRKNFDEVNYSDETYKFKEHSYEEEAEHDESNESREKFLDFLQQEELKSSVYFDQDDEQVIEDPLASTPLDNLNVFHVFKKFVQTLQAGDLNKYNALFGSLLEDDQVVIQDIFDIVD